MSELTAYHNGIRLCYEHTGGAGDPLLLIAGLAADMHYWHDDFCTALTHDLPKSLWPCIIELITSVADRARAASPS